MNPSNKHILTVNGGSSSIKFALFETGNSLDLVLAGGIERIGSSNTVLKVKVVDPVDSFSRPVVAADHSTAVEPWWLG